jgi:hypothetical protein
MDLAFGIVLPFAGTAIGFVRSCPQSDAKAVRPTKTKRPRTDAPARLVRGPLGEGFLNPISPETAYA